MKISEKIKCASERVERIFDKGFYFDIDKGIYIFNALPSLTELHISEVVNIIEVWSWLNNLMNDPEKVNVNNDNKMGLATQIIFTGSDSTQIAWDGANTMFYDVGSFHQETDLLDKYGIVGLLMLNKHQINTTCLPRCADLIKLIGAVSQVRFGTYDAIRICASFEVISYYSQGQIHEHWRELRIANFNDSM